MDLPHQLADVDLSFKEATATLYETTLQNSPVVLHCDISVWDRNRNSCWALGEPSRQLSLKGTGKSLRRGTASLARGCGGDGRENPRNHAVIACGHR
jgi:hypothetical protein